MTRKGRDYRTLDERVSALNDRHGVGVSRAREIVQRDMLRQDIYDAETVEDLKRVLSDGFPAMERSLDY